MKLEMNLCAALMAAVALVQPQPDDEVQGPLHCPAHHQEHKYLDT